MQVVWSTCPHVYDQLSDSWKENETKSNYLFILIGTQVEIEPATFGSSP